MHEREVEVAFSGERVPAEGHGDLLHRDLEAGRRERFHEDVCGCPYGLKCSCAVGRHRVDERQRRLVTSEERSDDTTACVEINVSRMRRRVDGVEIKAMISAVELPSRPTMEIAAPTTSPDALSRASADNAPGFARSVCKARFRSNPVAVWSIAAIASTYG